MIAYCNLVINLWRSRGLIPGVLQVFSTEKNSFFQDPTTNSLSAKTKQYEVIIATVAAIAG